MREQRKVARRAYVSCFPFLVPLFLGSSSRSIRALSCRAVCINSPAFMWTPSLSFSLHLTNGCGFHIANHKHRYSLEYHYFVLWWFLCTSVLLRPSGILHFSRRYSEHHTKTLNRLIRSLCGALEMFLILATPESTCFTSRLPSSSRSRSVLQHLALFLSSPKEQRASESKGQRCQSANTPESGS